MITPAPLLNHITNECVPSVAKRSPFPRFVLDVVRPEMADSQSPPNSEKEGAKVKSSHRYQKNIPKQ